MLATATLTNPIEKYNILDIAWYHNVCESQRNQFALPKCTDPDLSSKVKNIARNQQVSQGLWWACQISKKCWHTRINQFALLKCTDQDFASKVKNIVPNCEIALGLWWASIIYVFMRPNAGVQNRESWPLGFVRLGTTLQMRFRSVEMRSRPTPVDPNAIEKYSILNIAW